LGQSGQISRDPWRSVYFKADITDSIAAARHACRDAGELEVVGICSGSWYAAQTARIIGARAAILVNVLVWNWRTTSTVPSQWYNRKSALEAGAPGDPIVGSGESTAKRLKTLLNPGREPAKTYLHKHFPRSVLRVLSWVGLVWRPEVVLTALARSGVDVTVIASPGDAEQFTAKGGRAALDRLQGSAYPPRLIAAPTGDHSAHHPAILAEIRNAVLPVSAVGAHGLRRSAPSGSVASVRDQGGGEVFFVSADTARGIRPQLPVRYPAVRNSQLPGGQRLADQ
jgi:hypothetical protein